LKYFACNLQTFPPPDPVDLATIRLGHESLDVTLAYFKGKDAESQEPQAAAVRMFLSFL
jgi:hypothetical protein